MVSQIQDVKLKGETTSVDADADQASDFFFAK